MQIRAAARRSASGLDARRASAAAARPSLLAALQGLLLWFAPLRAIGGATRIQILHPRGQHQHPAPRLMRLRRPHAIRISPLETTTTKRPSLSDDSRLCCCRRRRLLACRAVRRCGRTAPCLQLGSLAVTSTPRGLCALGRSHPAPQGSSQRAMGLSAEWQTQLPPRAARLAQDLAPHRCVCHTLSARWA